MKRPSKSIMVVLTMYLLITTGCPTLFCGSIVVPAFLRAIKKSKHSQAEGLFAKAETHIQTHWKQHCQMPQALKPTSKLPVGGEKVYPSKDVVGKWFNVLGVNLNGDRYFRYHTERTAHEDTQTYVVISQADFVKGDAIHTYSQRFVGNTKTCQLEVKPATTHHEFE